MTDLDPRVVEEIDKLCNESHRNPSLGHWATCTDIQLENLARLAAECELERWLKDADIIGHRESGDAHKGRAWWTGGTWLYPGQVVAVIDDPEAAIRGAKP